MNWKSKTIAVGIVASSLLMLLLVSTAPAFSAVAEPHNADAMWIEPLNTIFDTNNATVGTMFNITAAMNFTEDVFAYQAVLRFNSTQLNCTRVGATAGSTSDYMSGHGTTFSKAINPGSYPPIGDLKSIAVAETCSAPDNITGPHSGTLFWVEFQIILAPNAGQSENSTFDISSEYTLTDTYVWDPTPNPYTFTPFDGNFSFVPELSGLLALIIIMASTLTVVLFSKNRISKKAKVYSN